jgi:hypothetical protein
LGVPFVQSVDIDLDGRLDTRRYFSKTAIEGVYQIERIETMF